MLQTIRNIFTIKDLRNRILFTLAMIAVYRVGSFVPIPFVSIDHIEKALTGGGLTGGLFGIADMFTGGAFSKLTVMALGIMPYISASIILQVLMPVIPRLEKIAKEGEAGRKKITQWTRYGTIVLAIIQSFGIALYVLKTEGGSLVAPAMQPYPALFIFTTIITVTAATAFLMWIGEKITEMGIGNGISLLIALGIMAAYPTYIRLAFQSVRLGDVTPIWLIIVAGVCVVATILIVLIQEGARKIPIQHAKQMMGRRMQAAQTNYLPLKVNTAGVMPVIFSSALLMLPTTVFGWLGASHGEMGIIGQIFAQQTRFNLYDMLGIQKESIFLLLKAVNMHTFLFVALTAFFCFFYTAIVFNPQDVADNLRRVGAFVPGYRPGKQTADYIDRVMTRITLVGAVFLCTVSVLPQLLTVSFEIPYTMAQFAGGTGLIIVVAVVLDTMKQVESRMLMRHYEGFKSRRQAGGGKRWSTREKRT